MGRQNRTDAVSALFLAHHRRLVGLSCLLVNDPGIAEEVVQKAFLTLYRLPRAAPNFYIELMQPNDLPAVWRDVLDSTGEGLQGIGFFVDDLSQAVRSSVELGASSSSPVTSGPVTEATPTSTSGSNSRRSSRPSRPMCLSMTFLRRSR